VTVAAVIVAASPESALADADGIPGVRRIVEAAWSGGAWPIVVVSVDPDGAVGAALAGSEAILAEPIPNAAGSPATQIRRGTEVASATVHDTAAALLWPTRMVWVGPETVTSLIEACGAYPDAMIRPAWQATPGWPVAVPVAAAERLDAPATDRLPDDIVADLVAAGVVLRILDLGDPGTVMDGATARYDLPPYEGPAPDRSRAGAEWGSPAADRPDDAPLSAAASVPRHEG
jgi:hypothetical protein